MHSGAVMLSLSRLAQVAYIFGLSLFLSLLLRPSLSSGQYRGNGILMPPPPMMPPVNNMMTASVGFSGGGMIGGMGGGMIGGMGGMMGMGGMGMMGMGGGMMGMMGMGG